ncbi:hypothetical protein CK203_039536 [Vitis vinifera]|uniref:Reverse transcriptase domain-containing protein n=2 Tax=Vitis vinifera TaxID=29760 RepID=A0A438HKJ9_VITVI|nr:hypothetical protein CK203_039536 [Vitis vinifera]CAN77090.1 hypothetical protein VITISV_017463 [Vitis vinifera]
MDDLRLAILSLPYLMMILMLMMLMMMKMMLRSLLYKALGEHSDSASAPAPRLLLFSVLVFGHRLCSNCTLMTQIFKPLIGRTVEVYIDNIVVKSETRAEHAQHLEEAFCLMQAYNMKLNPAKCAFDVSVGKFLGFMVTQRGIEVNSAQMKVVLETLASNKKKEL